jgi:hypothetical protein
MKNYLLRVEAVNLGHFVYDTNKIQPMRGGGFLLLESVQQLVCDDKPSQQRPKFAGVPLEKITTGASIGVFRFQVNDNTQPETVAQAVLESLNKATGVHATFVADWILEGSAFLNDLETLQAKNRWQQYQQPTLVLPPINHTATEECEYDGVRPGIPPNHQAGTSSETLSESVNFRKKNGKALRSTIYERILGEKVYDAFTADLHELAAMEGKGNLNNKIAFLYFDGNKFSKIRASKCQSAESLTKFSKTVEGARRSFLKALLEKARECDDFKTQSDAIRLETLLWGGDELEIIVPAWKGWEVAELFFEIMKDVNFDGIPLTHAGGMVFCGNKAPILQVRKMARDLADSVKQRISPAFDGTLENWEKTHDNHDALQILTLESFDTIGTSIEQFARTYYDDKAWDILQMGTGDMKNLKSAVNEMRQHGFPRNKIYDIVRAVKSKKTTKNIEDLLEASLSGNKEKKAVIENINKFVNGSMERWYMIADLWDYVGGK